MRSKQLAQHFIPALAIASLLAGPARAFFELPLQRPQIHNARRARPHAANTWTPDATPIKGSIGVPYFQLPSFVQRTLMGMAGTEATLQRMRDLALKATDGTLNTSQRVALTAFYQVNAGLFATITSRTHYEGFLLLDGSIDAILQGPAPRNLELAYDLPKQTLSILLGPTPTNIGTTSAAHCALIQVDSALSQVQASRAMLHSTIDQLESSAKGTQRGSQDLLVGNGFVPHFAEFVGAGIGRTDQTLLDMRALALRSTDGSLSDAERRELNAKFNLGIRELRIFANTYTIEHFVLFDGLGDTVLQDAGGLIEEVEYDLPDFRVSGLGIDRASLDSLNTSFQALNTLDTALDQIRQARADLLLAVGSLEL